jgi:hypothetical protein
VIAKVQADSLLEACEKQASIDPDFAAYFDEKSMTYFGCRLFDKELDAKKNFG